MKRILAACAVLLVAASCREDTPTTPAGEPIRVLFIGNSLTYTNDLPVMVDLLARASGENIVSDMIALPNYALVDHWDFGDAPDVVRSGNYDFVVLQQGPSSLPINRDSLRLLAGMWAPVIREGGAQPALFAVWPDVGRSFAFPDVSESYRLAASDVGGIFLPVGDTWIETWAHVPDAPLYGPDGYHPGEAGTFAAAVVIVARLTERDPTSLADNVNGVLLPQGLVNTIQSAAKTVIARTAPLYGRR